jgi:peroxiredoxin Q/BCP
LINEEKSDTQTLAIGRVAPDFTFKNGNKVMKLSDFRKRKIVVYFYPRDFTTGCTTEAAEFTLDYDKFKRAGIEIIGVSPDTEESHEKFREKMKIPYHLASDVNNMVSRKYGTYALKKFMGKEYMGVNRTTFLVNEDGRIVKVFSKVKPQGHSNQVLEAFEIKAN